MQSTVQDMIDPLFAAAQLVAHDSVHAAQLVKEVVDAESTQGHMDPDQAFERLMRLAGKSPSAFHGAGTGFDMISTNRLRDALDAALPRVVSRLSPARRLQLWRTYHLEIADPSTRDVFLHAISRELGSDISSADMPVIHEELAGAMERFFDTALAPTPPTLRAELEDSFSESGRRSGVETETAPVRMPWGARLAGAFLLILVAALVGMWLSRPSVPEPQPIAVQNILDMVAETSPSSDLILRNRDAAGIERFIEDRLERRVRIPEIQGARLSGMYVETLAGGVEIPVLQFTDGNESPILVWVLDYALLDRLSPGYRLEPGVLNQIAGDDAFDIRDSRESTLVVFRNRDDIFVAVTGQDGITFRQRVSFPS